MARWCLRNDKENPYLSGLSALDDDERFNFGCTDEWGTHHSCKGCPHNRYMGDGKPISISI